MHSKIPIPTDNIYKFYALFGLFMFIASGYVFIQIHFMYNDLAFNNYVEYEVLKDTKNPTTEQEAKKVIHERKMEIAIGNKKTFLQTTAFFIAISVYLMAFGFYKWHRVIQPIQDEIMKKQLEKLELEIEAIRSEKT